MNGDNKDIVLNKPFYGYKTANRVLDRSFKEFLPDKRSYQEFFDLYRKYFYNIQKNTHQYFFNKSSEYAYPEGFVSPVIIEQNELREQLADLKRQIDSLEKEHFFFKNTNFIMNKEHEELTEGQISSGQQVWYMQSGKKREIKSIETYRNIKTKIYKNRGSQSNKNIILFLSTDAINSLSNGPDIETLSDLSISNLEINIYPLTLIEYENNGNSIDILDQTEKELIPNRNEI